jgi:hypothetical protein
MFAALVIFGREVNGRSDLTGRADKLRAMVQDGLLRGLNSIPYRSAANLR